MSVRRDPNANPEDYNEYLDSTGTSDSDIEEQSNDPVNPPDPTPGGLSHIPPQTVPEIVLELPKNI